MQPEKPETLPAVVKRAVIPVVDRSTPARRSSCHVLPLSALPPGAEYYNGMPRAGYIVTLGPGYGPERSYAYPSAQIYRPARVVRPRHAVRHHRAMKRRVVEYRR